MKKTLLTIVLGGGVIALALAAPRGSRLDLLICAVLGGLVLLGAVISLIWWVAGEAAIDRECRRSHLYNRPAEPRRDVKR